MILQHLNTGPVKLAFDTESVLSVNDARTRVRYATNTHPGSSGSPCFTLTRGLVALHHLGQSGTQTVSAFNQGIPITAIRDRLTRRNKADVLGPELT
jgi:V8-like Glu-specific endopeptidase